MKIQNIQEISFKNTKDSKYHQTTYEGVVITFDDTSMLCIGIDEDQQCCESSGYITSHDCYEEFFGAEFLDYYITTRDLCTIENLPEIDRYDGDMMFFTIKTNKGDLQFVAYNEHNGYYAHDVVILKGGVEVELFSI